MRDYVAESERRVAQAKRLAALGRGSDFPEQQINGHDEPPPAESPDEFGLHENGGPNFPSHNGKHDEFAEADSTTQSAPPSDTDELPSICIQTSAQFVADFVPPDYIVDGLLQEGFLYSLTGATGSGKTSITLRLAASTALGVVFAGRETKKRRVLYLAAENPDDVRMRWIALAQQMDFDIGTIEVFFVKGVFKISRAKECLRGGREARRRLRSGRHRHQPGVL
jgi:hypothetical protein